MPSFLLISDVFCPWCYGFDPVAQRIFSEHPDFPVRVLSGQLMEERMSLDEMLEEMPNAAEFFERLQKTTGQEIGQAFLEQLRPGQGALNMYSPGVALPLAILKRLDPGREFEHMLAFQRAFYGEGKNVLGQQIQIELAAQFDVRKQDFEIGLDDPQMRELADRDADDALEIMGEFALYPTLFLLDEREEPQLLARGYIPYAEVSANLAAVLAAGGGEDMTPGAACGLDGKCS